MNVHYSDNRKIDPSQGPRLGDGTENDGNRVEIGPTALAHAEWREAGLELPDLAEMRKARHKRLTDAIVARGYGGLLMFDPLNIRYATDTTNMQLWNTHNPFRACLLCAMATWCFGTTKTRRFSPSTIRLSAKAVLVRICFTLPAVTGSDRRLMPLLLRSRTCSPATRRAIHKSASTRFSRRGWTRSAVRPRVSRWRGSHRTHARHQDRARAARHALRHPFL